MYDKRKFNKINDKKILHKVKKQWVTVSLALFMMIGGGAVATHINVSADIATNNQKVVNAQAQNNKSTAVTDQASQLHNRLVNNANVQALRLGGHHAKRNNINILNNRFKRSNNGKSLKKSGYVNTTKYHGHFIFNKYAPNDERAIVPKRLNLKHLNWAKGHFGRLNLTLFTHKRYGWLRLSNHNAKKYTKVLNGIYKNYKKSKHVDHSKNKKSHVTYISARNYKKLNRQLKKYRYSMQHGYKWSRKYNKHAYYALKSRMKYIKITKKYYKRHVSKNKSQLSNNNLPINQRNQTSQSDSNQASVTPNIISKPSQRISQSDMSTQWGPSQLNSNSSHHGDNFSNYTYQSNQNQAQSDGNPKPDATHKYLVPSNNGSDVVLTDNDLNALRANASDNYSDYDNTVSVDSDIQLVHIIDNTNLDGFNLEKIITPSDDNSDNGWVFSDELNDSTNARSNSDDFNRLSATLENIYHQRKVQQLQTEMQRNYTPEELSQVNNIINRYNYLKQNENNSNNIYAVKPDLPNHQVGQLTNSFKQDVTDWVNFYRGLYGLTPVTDNSNYDLQAQYGADDCDALNGIEHGLGGMSVKPSNITSSDWQKGIDATDSSNLYGGGASDPSEIQGYFDDGANLTGNNTGHRAWLLDQGLHNIGIGVDNGYGDLYVITPSDNSLTSSDKPNPSFKDIAFPNAGVFPYSDATSGPWSLYLPGSVSNNITVSIHDNTANTNIPVNDIELSSEFGYYDGIITYKPQNITADHQYTITISGQGIPNGKYTYTTKLFHLEAN